MSLASAITLANLVAADIMAGSNGNIIPALVISILIGILSGAINGLCIYILKVPAIIMTLAVGNVLLGIGLIYSKGAPKGYAAPLIKLFSTGRLLGVVPYIVILWVLLSALTIFLLNMTTYGRSIYAIGTNVEAARYSGINIALSIIATYAISGALAGVTGALYVGYTNTSFLNAGNAFMMSSVAAVVVGGTSAAGGKGGYAGTIAGAIIITILTAILTIINIQEAGRKIIEGAIILLLVFIYSRKNIDNAG
jgi:ribose transport system permease protein